jgi:3-hydroxyisobutyrate dehydrogenase-like beta-hydroxyacid dehydrogenase
MKGPIGVVGVGRMGAPMAFNLRKGGYGVVVWDASPKALLPFEGQEGIAPARSPADIAKSCHMILTVLPSSREVEAVLLGGAGMGPHLRPGTVIIDHTTADPASTKRVAKALKARQVHLLDAAMSGGVAGATAGTLTLMVGGDEGVYNTCRPVLEAVGRDIFYLGGHGSGHAMKLLHNMCSMTVFLATCEAAQLGMKWGFPLKQVIDVLQSGNARSYATEVRFPRYILPGTFNSGADVALFDKDLSLALKLAKDLKVPAPLSAEAYQPFAKAMKAGRAAEDHTRLFQRMTAARRRRK